MRRLKLECGVEFQTLEAVISAADRTRVPSSSLLLPLLPQLIPSKSFSLASSANLTVFLDPRAATAGKSPPPALPMVAMAPPGGR
jgi:hypothetical protein